MNLRELLEGLNSSLTQLDLARRVGRDSAAIESRLRQWLSELAKMQSAHERAAWLEIEPSLVERYGEQLSYTRQLTEEAAQRLEATPDVSVLTEEDLWVRLLQAANKSAETILGAVKQRWATKVAQFKELTPPNLLRATAPALPQNEEALGDYDKNYGSASRLAAIEFPKTPSDPDELAQSIERCKAAAARLRFDAPTDVQVFFRAVNAGGASMTLVTPTVLVWLEENDQLHKYTVRGNAR